MFAQASGLSPLLPLSASSQHHVQQLRTAPAALNFLLSAATSLHGAARRNPQALSMLLEPASALFDIHSAFTLHHLAQQQHQDAATACFLGAYPGSTRLPPPRPHAPRYQVHSSRGLVPPPKPSNSHQHPSDTSNTVGAPADNHDASKSQSRHLPAASEGTQPRDADTQQGDTSHGDRVTISANGTRVHGAHRRWRFVLDALMPVVSQLDSHNSVALELDVEQLLGMPHSPSFLIFHVGLLWYLFKYWVPYSAPLPHTMLHKCTCRAEFMNLMPTRCDTRFA